MLRIRLEECECVNIEGCAEVRILDGRGEIFGAPVERGKSIRVPYAKAIPYYALSTSELEIKGGRITSIPGYYVPRQWELAVGEIATRRKPVKVMITGDIDSGKSTLTTYIANKLFSIGFKVAVVDSDVGQSSIGPPCTIGLGIMKGYVISLDEIPLLDACFLGSNTPAGLFHKMIAGVVMMIERALRHNVDVILVDTTGWIKDEQGMTLKISKVKAVEPNLVIVLEEEYSMLAHFVKVVSEITDVLRLPKGFVRPRNRNERKKIRQNAYRRYMRGGKKISISLKSVKILEGPILTGIIHVIKQGKFKIYYEVSGNSVRIYTANRLNKEIWNIIKRKHSNVLNANVLNKENIRNLLIGIYNGDKRFMGIGILQDVDFDNKKIEIYTSVDPKYIKYLEVGRIKISPVTLTEIGRCIL